MKLKKCLVLFIQLLIPFVSLGQSDSGKLVYRKPLFDFDYRNPLFVLKNEQSNNKNRLLRYSALTGYREGVEPIKGMTNLSSYFDAKTETIRMYIFNASITEMLTYGMVPERDVILEVKDPSKYRYEPAYGEKLDWMRKNAYCFEYMFPRGTMKNLKMFTDELTHYLGVKFGWEMRLLDVLILFRTSSKDKLKSLGNEEENYNMKGNFRNVRLTRVVRTFRDAGLPVVLDETGYKEKVNLDLQITNWKDLEVLRKSLQRYDLDIKSEKREMRVFVIHDNIEALEKKK